MGVMLEHCITMELGAWSNQRSHHCRTITLVSLGPHTRICVGVGFPTGDPLRRRMLF
jgi:hypothetical protein